MAHPDQVQQTNAADLKTQEIKQAEMKVQKSQKRVKCTSVLLILLGLVGVASSLYHNFTAKFGAKKMIENAFFGGKNPHYHDQHHGSQMHEGKPNLHELFVSRNEFDIYDSLKTVTLISFFMAIIVLIFGKCGLKSIKFSKSNFTKCILCKSKIGFGILVVLGVFAGF